MPVFANPMGGGLLKKRKSEEGHDQRESKRPAFQGPSRVWMVQWRLPQTRKHKTWNGDGVLLVEGARFVMFDTDGKKYAFPVDFHAISHLSIKDPGNHLRRLHIDC